MGIVLNFNKIDCNLYSIFLCNEKTKRRQVYLGKYVRKSKAEKKFMPDLCRFKFNIFLRKYLTTDIIIKDRDFKIIYKLFMDE